jgi:hypothetical protein
VEVVAARVGLIHCGPPFVERVHDEEKFKDRFDGVDVTGDMSEFEGAR